MKRLFTAVFPVFLSLGVSQTARYLIKTYGISGIDLVFLFLLIATSILIGIILMWEPR